MDKFTEWFFRPLNGTSTNKPCSDPFGPAEKALQQKHLYGPLIKYRNASTATTKKAPKLSFNEYVGQYKAKNILMTYIKKYKGTALPHIIIHGNAGCGKTTLARTIASEHNVPFVEIISKSITNNNQLVSLIKGARGGIVFIDELHGLKRDKAEIIYTMMEDFKFNGEKIKPFTLVGATTEYGELLRTRRPFVDRFKINIELEPYDISTIEFLIRGYAEKKYKDVDIKDDVFKAISENCRLTPRTAIRLLESTVCFDNNYAEVLQNFNIVKDGYTVKDIKVLEYLAKNKSCGIDSIAAFINTPKQSYLYEVEPYLLQTGMVNRKGSGRTITQDGLNFLRNLVSKP